MSQGLQTVLGLSPAGVAWGTLRSYPIPLPQPATLPAIAWMEKGRWWFLVRAQDLGVKSLPGLKTEKSTGLPVSPDTLGSQA